MSVITMIEDELIKKWFGHIHRNSTWKDSAEFVEWCLANEYVPGTKLKRLVNSLPWGPDNTVFAGEQAVAESDALFLTDKERVYSWNKTVNRLRRHWGLEPFPEG